MAIELFFSYAHEDEALRNKLANHLIMLRRQGVINTWHDREITAGTEWRGAIDEHLESADIILLLISADFLASDYCWEVEMCRAMERHKARKARVIPVLLREVDWSGAPFRNLQALPTNAVPVTSSSWFNLDEAFTNIAEGIRRVALEIKKLKMLGPDTLYEIVERISRREHTDADIEILRQFLVTNQGKAVLQFGKYNVNIEEGREIHIGPRTYTGDDAETIRQIVREIMQEPVLTFPPPPHEPVVCIDLGNGITLELVTIPSGPFMMGASSDESDREDESDRKANELHEHEVTVQSFLMGKYPVTQAQWRIVAHMPPVNRELPSKPAYFKRDNLPVETVSWDDVVEFCNRLSRHTGRKYRLPSEAEWEYACRAGTETRFYFGETITSEQANYNQKATNSVGRFPPNAFGLYDLHGNVWEWCEDIWHENYENAPRDGNAWTIEGDQSKRLLRGGSWRFDLRRCRSASRYWYLADRSNNDIGFRVARSIVSQQ